MKYLFLFILITLFPATYAQESGQLNQTTDYSNNRKGIVTLHARLQVVIDSIAQWTGYEVKFVGNNLPNEVLDIEVSKDAVMADMLDLFNRLGRLTRFAYAIRGKTVIIDDYYRYQIDTNKTNKESSYIRTYYDNSRKCTVMAFRHIRPSRLLDSLLKLYDRPEKNRTRVAKKLTVTGILPLTSLSTIQGILFDMHHWDFYREDSQIVIKQKKAE